jgi:hypothetical protein
MLGFFLAMFMINNISSFIPWSQVTSMLFYFSTIYTDLGDYHVNYFKNKWMNDFIISLNSTIYKDIMRGS